MVASFVQGSNVDDNGHGTHVSGTIGSKTYGVAKKVNIYGIKVLRYDNQGQFSDIIAGMDYVQQDVPKRNCPNGVVINMSLGGGYTQASNDAARRLVQNGYFVAVAAGNNNDDASYYSPASEPSVCTVGGTAKDDTRYNNSNYGRSVDILGPAVDVYSTFPNGQTVRLFSSVVVVLEFLLTIFRALTPAPQWLHLISPGLLRILLLLMASVLVPVCVKPCSRWLRGMLLLTSLQTLLTSLHLTVRLAKCKEYSFVMQKRRGQHGNYTYIKQGLRMAPGSYSWRK